MKTHIQFLILSSFPTMLFPSASLSLSFCYSRSTLDYPLCFQVGPSLSQAIITPISQLMTLPLLSRTHILPTLLQFMPLLGFLITMPTVMGSTSSRNLCSRIRRMVVRHRRRRGFLGVRKQHHAFALPFRWLSYHFSAPFCQSRMSGIVSFLHFSYWGFRVVSWLKTIRWFFSFLCFSILLINLICYFAMNCSSNRKI